MGKSKWINKKAANRKVQPAAQNPKFNKYRMMAKNKVAFSSKDSLPLTQQNLQILQGMKDEPIKNSIPKVESIVDDENKSEIEFTEEQMDELKGYKKDCISEAETFATNFTNCTNASFSYFMNKFNSGSAIHKEMLSILAASTEILNAKGSDGTEEEYFSILLNSFYTSENVLSLTANSILAYYVIRKLNSDVLRSKFSEFQDMVAESIKKYLNASNVTFIRFLLKSYLVFLKNQNLEVWSLPHTEAKFTELLLGLITHSKSRIRKLAKQCIFKLISNADFTYMPKELKQERPTHPAIKITCDFCVRRIKNTSGEDISSALYCLNMLKEIIIYLPTNELKQICETLIGLLLLGNALIFTNCMQALENLFKSKSRFITTDLNNKVMLALYDCQPELNDNQPLMAWSAVMKTAALSLFEMDKNLFSDHLLRLFAIFANAIQNESDIVKRFVSQCMNELLFKAISAKIQIKDNVFNTIAETLLSFLCYKHSSTWSFIFKNIRTLFILNDEKYKIFVKQIFDKLIELKETCPNEFSEQDFEQPIASLIKNHGIEFVFETVKLEPIESMHTVTNSWLINIIRKNLKSDKISNFIKYILPICEKIVPKNATEQQICTWSFAYSQLWSLLPVFCDTPTDVEASFKNIAKTLGMILSEGSQVRNYIMKALRQLINKSICDDSKEVARYAKNFIPILLNIYMTVGKISKPDKLVTFDTLAHYFTIANEELVEEIYEKVLQNYTNESDLIKKELYLDILRCIICHLKNEQKVISALEDALVTITDNKNKREQKKGLRLIEELLKSNNYQLVQNYYKEKGENFYNNMVKYFAEKYSSISILSAQASFVRIMQHVINENFKTSKMTKEELNNYLPILINIFQSKKSASLSQSTFNILFTIIDLTEDGPSSTIQFLITNLEEVEISFDRKATLFYMLHNLIMKYVEKVDKNTKTELVRCLVRNFDSKHRKMTQIVLVFIKDWFKINSTEEMLSLVSEFINYLNGIENPEQPEYRFKIRTIIEKLLKKFGHETIKAMLSKKYHKLIKNIVQKSKKEKKETNKKVRNEFDDSEEDESEDETEEISVKKNNRSSKRWKFDKDEDFDGFNVFDSTELENFEVENEGFNKQKDVTEREVKIIKDDKEKFKLNVDGEIVEEEVNENMKNSDDESNDEENVKKGKPKENKNVSKKIMDKYRRKRGIHRDTTVTGAEYRVSKAKGDMKRKDMPDPYAYYPLNRSTLNKRKAVKNKSNFNNVVKAAIKGAKNVSKKRFKK